jgi:hypothetical protein
MTVSRMERSSFEKTREDTKFRLIKVIPISAVAASKVLPLELFLK